MTTKTFKNPSHHINDEGKTAPCRATKRPCPKTPATPEQIAAYGKELAEKSTTKSTQKSTNLLERVFEAQTEDEIKTLVEEVNQLKDESLVLKMRGTTYDEKLAAVKRAKKQVEDQITTAYGEIIAIAHFKDNNAPGDLLYTVKDKDGNPKKVWVELKLSHAADQIEKTRSAKKLTEIFGGTAFDPKAKGNIDEMKEEKKSKEHFRTSGTKTETYYSPLFESEATEYFESTDATTFKIDAKKVMIMAFCSGDGSKYDPDAVYPCFAVNYEAGTITELPRPDLSENDTWTVTITQTGTKRIQYDLTNHKGQVIHIGQKHDLDSAYKVTVKDRSLTKNQKK